MGAGPTKIATRSPACRTAHPVTVLPAKDGDLSRAWLKVLRKRINLFLSFSPTGCQAHNLNAMTNGEPDIQPNTNGQWVLVEREGDEGRGAAPAASIISFPSFLPFTESLLLPCTGTTIPSIFFLTSCEGLAAA